MGLLDDLSKRPDIYYVGGPLDGQLIGASWSAEAWTAFQISPTMVALWVKGCRGRKGRWHRYVADVINHRWLYRGLANAGLISLQKVIQATSGLETEAEQEKRVGETLALLESRPVTLTDYLKSAEETKRGPDADAQTGGLQS